MDRLPRSNKGKSARRWKDGRKLDKEILPTLPSPGAVAVFMVCWFHAEYTERGYLVFDLTSKQVADRTGMTRESAKKMLARLTKGGVFAIRKNGCNQGGRSLGAERRITFQPYQKRGTGIPPLTDLTPLENGERKRAKRGTQTA